jgi:hypothetical protein
MACYITDPLRCRPTYVTRIPDGEEEGSFLALTMADKL